MKRILAGAVLCLLIPSSEAFSQGTDTYVSSTGSDGNNCLRATPCLTFAVAFAELKGSGVIHVLDSGAYDQFTITHSVTIDGGGIATTLFGGGIGMRNAPQFLVNAGASDIVTIQNFTMSGSGEIDESATAISVTGAGAVHVQNCLFTSYAGATVDFRATGGLLEMKNVTITGMPSGTGVYVANARALLEQVAIHNTQTAVLSAGSSTVSVTRSTFNGNGEALAAAYGPTAELHVDDCMLTNNEWAVVVSQGAKAYVAGSTLVNNTVAALFNDGVSFLISYGTNKFASNASDGAFTSTLTTR